MGYAPSEELDLDPVCCYERAVAQREELAEVGAAPEEELGTRSMRRRKIFIDYETYSCNSCGGNLYKNEGERA